MSVIALADLDGRRATALWQDGRLEDLFIDAPEDDPTPRPGAIHAARVERPLKGLGGCLLALADGQTGFLREARGLAPGDRVLVQVSTYAERGKSAPVTRRILFKSRYVIITPDAPGLNVARAIRDEERRDDLRSLAHDVAPETPFGMILRSSCAAAEDGDIAADIAETCALAEQVMADDAPAPALLVDGPGAELLAWRDWPTDAEVIPQGGFDQLDIWSELDALAAPRFDLPGGAWMAIEQTAALTLVDVNTGGDLSPAACLKANRQAAQALPRALRLKGLGGQVLVDFAPMGKKDRREMETLLRRNLKACPVETSFAGWSNLGLAELVRKRERRPFGEVI